MRHYYTMPMPKLANLVGLHLVLLCGVLPVIECIRWGPPPIPGNVIGSRVLDLTDGQLRVDVISLNQTNTTATATTTTDGPAVGPDQATWLRARGVQYAQHPLGNLRWRSPIPLGKWDGVYDALAFGDDCVNAPVIDRLASIQFDSMSEACLFLNVWAPLPLAPGAEANRSGGSGGSAGSSAPGTALKPVMFWMHGGSFTFGGTSNYHGNPMFVHRRDVVLVTANYRLGALGWMGGAAVARQNAGGSSGNFGLQDTRAAMQWVQRNIGAFGGDPDRVTIFGESAGASLVETHLVAPKSDGLFHRGIMQSGPFDNYTVQLDPELGFSYFASAANCTGADDDAILACLKGKPIWSVNAHDGRGLIAAIGNSSQAGLYSPVVDGVELTATPEVLAQAGKLNPSVTAVMVGTNLNEGRFLMPLVMPVPNAPNSTETDVRQWLAEYYGQGMGGPLVNKSLVDAVVALYAESFSTIGPWQTASQIYTESQYLCPTERSARWLTISGTPTYVYRLTYQPSNMWVNGIIVDDEAWCNDYVPCRNATAESIGVGHSSDVYLLFNEAIVGLNATDRVVGAQMIDYWQSFAAAGNPNTGVASSRPVWPAYGKANTTQILNTVPHSVDGIQAARCAFWARQHPVPYNK